MPKENYMAPGPTQAEFNALDAEVDALNSKVVRAIPSGTDLNTLTESGYYDTGNAVNLTNAPVSGTNRLGLIVQKSENGYVFQLATENLQSTYGVFTRRCLNGTWTSWEQLALNSKLTNYTEITGTTDASGNVTVSDIPVGNVIKAIPNRADSNYYTSFYWCSVDTNVSFTTLIIHCAEGDGTPVASKNVKIRVYHV